jgi:hypothetical protein
MKKILSLFTFALFASCAAFLNTSPSANADTTCYQNAVPTPLPTTGAYTLPVCIGGVLQTTGGGGGATPIPYPTGTGGVLQVTGTGSAGASNIPASPAPGVLTVQGILFGQGLIVQIGGSTKSILTSSSPTACTSLEVNTGGMLAEIINTGAAQTVFLQVYDEGTTPTCASADAIWGDGTTLTLGPGQVVTFGIPLAHGLSYKLSGALGANVVITRNG